MDSLIASAARSLAAGDPFAALKRVALRDDPAALALRGIAIAQLGDYPRARKLLVRAARDFGDAERLARARCQVAEAEVALAANELARPTQALDAAARALEELGDHANAVHARLVGVRRQLLVGEIEAAGRALGAIDVPAAASPALVARVELTRAELAVRHIRAAEAAASFDRAHAAAIAAGVPALAAEIDRARRALSLPSARLIRAGVVRLIGLGEVEALFASCELVVDGCRREVRGAGRLVPLAGRPVLFALASALAEAWPADATREQLIERVFRARAANESHRARLRVELSRLRAILRPLARIEASIRGYLLVPVKPRSDVAVLAPPIDGPSGPILALLERGEPWSTSALAHALGLGQRSVQRALRELLESKLVRAAGHGRSRRWLAPSSAGFATDLLLPGALPVG